VEKKSIRTAEKCIRERIKRISVEDLKPKQMSNKEDPNKSKSISRELKPFKAKSDQNK